MTRPVPLDLLEIISLSGVIFLALPTMSLSSSVGTRDWSKSWSTLSIKLNRNTATTTLSSPCHSQLPVGLAVEVEITGGMEKVVRLPGQFVVEDGLAQLALDQLFGRLVPLQPSVVGLQVLL